MGNFGITDDGTNLVPEDQGDDNLTPLGQKIVTVGSTITFAIATIAEDVVAVYRHSVASLRE